MSSLFKAASEKADDPEEIQKEFEELYGNKQPEQPQIPNLMCLDQEIQSTNSQKHAVGEFSKQESVYNEQIQKEVSEYKDNFDKLSEKIKEQEKILTEVTEKFNNCMDKDEKIKLFENVNEEMCKLVAISYNYGNAVQKSDVSYIIDTLSAYDWGYDENQERKIIKKL